MLPPPDILAGKVKVMQKIGVFVVTTWQRNNIYNNRVVQRNCMSISVSNFQQSVNPGLSHGEEMRWLFNVKDQWLFSNASVKIWYSPRRASFTTIEIVNEKLLPVKSNLISAFCPSQIEATVSKLGFCNDLAQECYIAKTMCGNLTEIFALGSLYIVTRAMPAANKQTCCIRHSPIFEPGQYASDTWASRYEPSLVTGILYIVSCTHKYLRAIQGTCYIRKGFCQPSIADKLERPRWISLIRLLFDFSCWYPRVLPKDRRICLQTTSRILLPPTTKLLPEGVSKENYFGLFHFPNESFQNNTCLKAFRTNMQKLSL